MVERFHRQLKSSLKAQEHSTHWLDVLPLVMLGIRSAIKDDLAATTAELVYGATLRLPAQFFSCEVNSLPDPTDFMSRLKSHMLSVRVKAPRSLQKNFSVHKELSTCTHVFVRCDAVRKPLQPPYDRPFEVIDRKEKYFILDFGGRKNTVAIDRLKPAYLDDSYLQEVTGNKNLPPLTSSSPTTLSGRQVHFPNHLSSYVL